MSFSRSKTISRLSYARPCVVSDTRRYVVGGRGGLVGLARDDSAHVGAVAAGGDVGLAEEGVVERDLAVAAVELPGAVVDGVGGVVEEGVGDVESAVADADEDVAAMWGEGDEEEWVGWGEVIMSRLNHEMDYALNCIMN